ncbi:glycine zipper 2TM domain-containing protein [Vibrio parahaemolyticus]|uniref:glycine zipper 2TM domain-containing protein n=1 Tax=Vibrio parahaemolyticus TaxID=670 RepID=UPI000400729F|nr:glycine zipper 2TM domain-containing protein [Vibrio parahaemolyticus]EJG1709825.1 glycine zipper 2TM domain-containing protein [Vibrio parahaemolyticus]EJG1741328.1 glycine zipper 2TM domain-containing protein [Vibrio parahaemolyticus]EJG1779130.1 glycine zipper 2TM domain-containing protein [Vibrio parahaemolyticus]MDF4732691.1 glycine zipper 2TM domain-containing protein [Vibrio parahaemolyticus]MDG2605464.1 glycine zipper 2TM domain-containing protein [Vibrio parahaemolyticus]
MKKHIKLGILLTITCAFVLGGCSSPNPYGDAYGSSDTRKVQQVYYGTIEKVEPVTIDASTQSNAIGTIAGAAVGGILGSKIGGGSGSDIAAIGGGLLGGYAGSKAAEATAKRNGVNLTIRLEDGKIISVVQEANPNMIFQPGQAVQINMSGNDARVVPR